MANANPVNRGKKEAVVVQVINASGVPDAKRDAELLARAKDIVAGEVPDVPDELVNTLGQERNYGKIAKVQELEYAVVDRKGEPTGETRTALRVDH